MPPSIDMSCKPCCGSSSSPSTSECCAVTADTLHGDIYVNGNGPYPITLTRAGNVWSFAGPVTIDCVDSTEHSPYTAEVSQIELDTNIVTDCFQRGVFVIHCLEDLVLSCGEGRAFEIQQISCDPLLIRFLFNGVEGIHSCFDMYIDVTE